MEEFMKQHYETDLDKMQLIRDAKKEVFDDVDKVRVTNDSFGEPAVFVETLTEYIEVKKKHLGEGINQ